MLAIACVCRTQTTYRSWNWMWRHRWECNYTLSLLLSYTHLQSEIEMMQIVQLVFRIHFLIADDTVDVFALFFLQGVRLQSPNIPPVRDYIDLCDGVCLAYLISYYCPSIIPWTSVRLNYMPTVEDSISNILLVSNFSQKHLPYSVFHMTPQDVVYMRG